MQRRFEKLFGEGSSAGLVFRTINGICYKMIQQYARLAGKSEDSIFRLITDEKESAKIISGFVGVGTDTELKGILNGTFVLDEKYKMHADSVMNVFARANIELVRAKDVNRFPVRRHGKNY